eukprot:Pompholyxophrys_sp_v1_NODE_6_length_8036_cov_9.951134.p3 type:complete len:179 gc:universal NODE_6_length_8036_cov_9.951134:689-1225(+)
MEPIPGMRSLNEKIKQLEGLLLSVANEVRPVSHRTTIEQFHDEIQKSKQQKSLSNLSKLKSEFENTLIKELSGLNMTKCMSRVVDIAVTYIENNIGKIASTLAVNVSSELKLSTCVSFIKSVISTFNEDDLINCINHFVEILFPKKEEESVATTLNALVTTSNALVTTKNKKKVNFKF